MNRTTAAPTIGKAPVGLAAERGQARSAPGCRSGPQPSRSPAAPEKTIAVSSNGPCAVTNVKKFAAFGLVAMWPKTVPRMTPLESSS